MSDLETISIIFGTLMGLFASLLSYVTWMAKTDHKHNLARIKKLENEITEKNKIIISFINRLDNLYVLIKEHDEKVYAILKNKEV